MYVKVTNDTPIKYPYTVGDLRRDNPKTSFPKNVPITILANYGVLPVVHAEQPAYDPLVQTLKRDDMPTRVNNEWTIGYTVENLPQEQAEANVRRRRDDKLAATDWRVIKAYETSSNLPAEWELYRQALRDITTQVGFPHTVEWPVEPV